MKKLFFRIGLLTIAIVMALAFMTNAQAAANYPRRAIELVIPFGAGSSSDTFARQYAQIVEKYLGKPINCVNYGGAGTVEGMTYAWGADTEGYTIMEITPSLLIKELMNASDIKFRAEFEPLIKVQNDVQLMGVAADSPFQTFEDLKAYALEHPGELKIGGISPGALDDYIANGLANAAGFQWTYVPYKSGSEVKAAVLGGELDVYQDKMINFLPMVQSGDIRPLIILNDTVPDIPELAGCVASKEIGIDFTQGSWRGFCIKKGVPQEVKDILVDALTKAYEDPAYKQMEKDQMTNLSVGYRTPEQWAIEWDEEYSALHDTFLALGYIDE